MILQLRIAVIKGSVCGRAQAALSSLSRIILAAQLRCLLENEAIFVLYAIAPFVTNSADFVALIKDANA